MRRGDTLWSIARRYNTTIANIVRLNRIQNANLIYPRSNLEFNSLNYVYLHKMYYDKFELGGTYEGSIETKECKQKVPSEKW